MLSPVAFLRSRAMAAYAKATYELQAEKTSALASDAGTAQALSPSAQVEESAILFEFPPIDLPLPMFGPFRTGAPGTPPQLRTSERDMQEACLDEPGRREYVDTFIKLVEYHHGPPEVLRQLWILWTLRPSTTIVTDMLAERLAKAGDAAAAISVARWGLEAGGWADAWLVRDLSERYWVEGRTDEALEVLRTAMRKPAFVRSPEIPVWLVDVLLRTRDLPQNRDSWWLSRSLCGEAKAAAKVAVSHFERTESAACLEVADIETMVRNMAEALGMRSAALRLLVEARRLTPEDAFWFDLAEAGIWRHAGNTGKVSEIFAKLSKQLVAAARRGATDETGELFRQNLRLAELALKLRDVKSAIAACHRALALQPRNDRLRIFYATILLEAGRTKSAASVVGSVWTPSLAKEKFMLQGLAARKEKKFSLACDLFAKAEQAWNLENLDLPELVEELPESAADSADSMFDPAMFYLEYSLVCEAAGRIELGIKKAKQAYAYAPDSAEVQNGLAYLLADHKRELGLAEILVRTALKQEPENSAFLDTLAWVLFRADRKPEALAAIRQAVRYAEAAELGDGILLDHAGDIAAACGRLREANLFWHRALKQKTEERTAIQAKLDRLSGG